MGTAAMTSLHHLIHNRVAQRKTEKDCVRLGLVIQSSADSHALTLSLALFVSRARARDWVQP